MRIRIELKKLNSTVIDLNHSYHIASLIYRCVQRSDPTLSLELHKPGMKFWTFSKLMVPGRRFKIIGDKMLIESDTVHFYFSTPKTEIATAFVEGLLRNPEVRIGSAEFSVSEVKVVREREIGRRGKFVTLSPISVTTVRDGRTYDLYPDDPKFYENIRRNLIRKFVALHGEEPSNCELEIKPLKVKPKRIRVKNTYHRCVEMVFLAEGSRELIELGYKAGFGERNSMGFGMVKVV